MTQLLARDMDNDPLVFGVSGEEASCFFAVEPDTGVVWLRQPLDRETKSEFTVEFSVSDHQGVITRKVNIQVGDVNDNVPTFHNQPYSVCIPEVGTLGHPSRVPGACCPQATGQHRWGLRGERAAPALPQPLLPSLGSVTLGRSVSTGHL